MGAGEARAPPLKIGKYFSGNYYVKFGQATAIKVKSCKEMADATSVMPVVTSRSVSGVIPSIEKYAAIGCKLQLAIIVTCSLQVLS